MMLMYRSSSPSLSLSLSSHTLFPLILPYMLFFTYDDSFAFRLFLPSFDPRLLSLSRSLSSSLRSLSQSLVLISLHHNYRCLCLCHCLCHYITTTTVSVSVTVTTHIHRLGLISITMIYVIFRRELSLFSVMLAL